MNKEELQNNYIEMLILDLEKHSFDYWESTQDEMVEALRKLQQENKQLKYNWNKLKEYFNERIEVCDNRLSSPFCNFEKATKERLIFSQCLEKLEELEQGVSNVED